MDTLTYTKTILGKMGLYSVDGNISITDWILFTIIVVSISSVVVTSTIFTIENVDDPALLIPIVFATLYIVAFSVSVTFYIIEMCKRESIKSVLNDMDSLIEKRKMSDKLSSY